MWYFKLLGESIWYPFPPFLAALGEWAGWVNAPVSLGLGYAPAGAALAADLYGFVGGTTQRAIGRFAAGASAEGIEPAGAVRLRAHSIY